MKLAKQASKELTATFSSFIYKEALNNEKISTS